MIDGMSADVKIVGLGDVHVLLSLFLSDVVMYVTLVFCMQTSCSMCM